MKKILLIGWVAMREMIFERVFYLLLGFIGLALFLSILLGQLSYIEQAKLTLDFMLGAIHISMVLLSVFMGVRLFQHELNLGSVSMVLSKPISPSTFLMGKFIGQLTVQLVIVLFMAILTYFFCWRLHATISFASIFQTCSMIFFEVSLLTAITYAFSVNMGGVTASICTVTVFCVGHLRGSSGRDPGLGNGMELLLSIVRGLIPDLELFNTKALASYGLLLDWTTFSWAALYAFLCLAFYLFVAIVCFDQKDIFT